MTPANEVEYDITQQDVIAYQFVYLRKSGMQRRGLRGYMLAGPALWLTVAAVVYFDGRSQIRLVFVAVMLALSVIWVAMARRNWTNTVRRNVRRALALGRNRTVLGHHRLRVSVDGVEHWSEYRYSRTAWPAVESIEETPDFVLIYLGAGMAQFAPKRAFTHTSEQVAFLQLARSYREQAVGIGGYLP